MADQKLRNPGGETHAEFDRDVDIRAVVYIGAGLVAITFAAFVLMWFFFEGLAAYEERQDPAPPVLPEAAAQAPPSGPTLQATPERDLEELLAIEHELLESYGLSEDGEHARVPIERAMEMALERGIGTPRGERIEEVGEPDVVTGDLEGDVGLSPDELAPRAEPTESELLQRPDTTIDENPEGPDGR